MITVLKNWSCNFAYLNFRSPDAQAAVDPRIPSQVEDAQDAEVQPYQRRP